MTVMSAREETKQADGVNRRPLEQGEEMDQRTFHERYKDMAEGVRAELIGGVVHIMPAPVSKTHGRHLKLVFRWLVEFEDASPGVESLAETTVILGPRSEPQPDAWLRILPSYGGQTRDENDYVTGAPELVVEVAVSTKGYDLNQKKQDYQERGAGELIVVLPGASEVAWFLLREGQYTALDPEEDGILRSRFFPGLWLDPVAMLALDWRGVRKVVRQGIKSAEHKEWAARMKAYRMPERRKAVRKH